MNVTLPYKTVCGGLVPYDTPEIIDRFLNPREGTRAVVIKAQIDHCGWHGKQYEWCGYIIKGDKVEMVRRECAYQSELKEGKMVVMRARDLI